ncbi:response regulator transcription factor [Robinsoniella peoriensis]|uniref:response regulator transcription factor n=1 Tax=Robinsoniella peoriensis TaxID=180332 RepID=UPI00085C8510|nr:response regulator [Robinsoniella peoriensis]
MLKLIIADDERVIRETISSFIDWEEIGIKLVGLCSDGIEAYNMILDETPDIVMTDIRMPGLSGLDLVREIAQTNPQIQFIILSGYEDFEYAREAMKYGIRHYLLKPCNEEKIRESIIQAREECLRIKQQMEEKEQQSAMTRTIRQDAIFHLLMDGIALEREEGDIFEQKVEGLQDFYGQYIDLYQRPCHLCYVYFLERVYLEQVLEELRQEEEERNRQNIFYGIYVNNILLLFCYEQLDMAIFHEHWVRISEHIQLESARFPNLQSLLEVVLTKIKRYDTIYAIHNYRPIVILNNQNVLQHLQLIFQQLGDASEVTVKKMCKELRFMVDGAAQSDFLQMLGNSICTHLPALGICSLAEVTETVRDIQMTDEKEELRLLLKSVIDRMEKELCLPPQRYGMLVEKVMTYVEEHLSEQNLTLKKIAEQHLYMNVDYVSRQFKQSTGDKFSQYLTEQRVKRAKELLMNADTGKIQYVAEQVGCGNNPQYFSNIFKKLVGMTPGRWAAQMQKKE